MTKEIEFQITSEETYRTYAKVDGREIAYSSRDDLILKLREAYFTTSEIGQLVNLSRARVHQVLKDKGQDGELDYSALDNPAIYEQNTDEELAHRFRKPIKYIVSRRTALGIERRKGEHRPTEQVVEIRQKYLAQALFGKDYLPGKKFKTYIRRYIKKLTPEAQAKMLGFYFDGDYGQDPRLRSYRAQARKQLSNLINNSMVIDDLVRKEVLNIAY